MFRPRIIPVLLLKDNILVKSVKFKTHNYIGDPINAVRMFNEFKADELVFLDIETGKKKQSISLDIVKKIGEEADMPFAVGGGISTIPQIRDLINAGAEKVVLGRIAAEDPGFVKKASNEFGASTICVCIDVKKNFWGKDRVYIENGKHKTDFEPIAFAEMMERNGAGDLIVQSIDRDGTMQGYDISLIRSIANKVNIPVTALGGAGNNSDFVAARNEGNATGLAAGSYFVYYGKNKGVLISYPDKNEINF